MKKVYMLVGVLLLGTAGNIFSQDIHGPKDWYFHTPAMQALALESAKAAVAEKIGKKVYFRYQYVYKSPDRIITTSGQYSHYIPGYVTTKVKEKVCRVLSYNDNTDENVMAFSIEEDCFRKFYGKIAGKSPQLLALNLIDTKRHQSVSLLGMNCSQKVLNHERMYTCQLNAQ